MKANYESIATVHHNQKLAPILPLLLILTLLNTAGQTHADVRPSPAETGNILFEDSMTGDWRDQWFLDGEKAMLTQDENGLHFQAGSEPNVQQRRNESPEMRELYDSYHAVLWTQQEFEGEVGISFEMNRTSSGFTFLIYMLAQGVGWGPYAEDITEWNDLRKISSMYRYHDGMNLTCVTFRWQIRFRRYPWKDEDGNQLRDTRFGKFIENPEYDWIPVENSYKVNIELRTETLRIRLEEIGNPENFLDRTFSRVDNLDPRRPAPSTRGRIGIRHMFGTGVRYRNFQVRQLSQ